MVGPVYVRTYVLCNNCRYSDEFNACPVYDFNGRTHAYICDSRKTLFIGLFTPVKRGLKLTRNRQENFISASAPVSQVLLGLTLDAVWPAVWPFFVWPNLLFFISRHTNRQIFDDLFPLTYNTSFRKPFQAFLSWVTLPYVSSRH